MFAFLVNALTVVIGSIIGLLFKKRIKKETCDQVLKALGIIVLLIGIFGVIENMVSIIDGKISFDGTLLLIISITIGTFIGEALKIDDGLNKMGSKLEIRFKKGKMAEAFVVSTLLYCVGSMTIVGSLESALGNPETIYLKAALDGITSIVLASTLGPGVILSSISVILYQGLLTLLFVILGDFLPMEFIKGLGMVGYVLVAGNGLNFLIKDKIKVANMLPSFIIIIIIQLILYFI